MVIQSLTEKELQKVTCVSATTSTDYIASTHRDGVRSRVEGGKM